MPMCLSDQEFGRYNSALKSVDRYKSSLSKRLSSSSSSISTTWNIKFISSPLRSLRHYFNDFWDGYSIPRVQTIRVPSERCRDHGESMSQNRIYFSSILVLILFISSCFPTADAMGLGLARQKQDSHNLPPQDSSLPDSEKVSQVPADDNTVKIRTREAQQPQSFFPQQQIYVDPNYLQRGVAPNYLYFPANPFNSYNMEPRLYTNYPYNNGRRQQNQRKRKRQRNGKCPKICDTCYRSHELDKENDELQKRFSAHVKPALLNNEAVEALFKYMDQNNDGLISQKELRNYLLLHNIISPDPPY